MNHNRSLTNVFTSFLLSVLLGAVTLTAALPPAHTLASGETTITITDQEAIRNGGFDLDKAAWYMEYPSDVGYDDGLGGSGMRLGPVMSTEDGKYSVFQEVYPPDTLTAATFDMDFHYSWGIPPAHVNLFAVLLSVEGEQGLEPLAVAYAEQNLPLEDSAWYHRTYSFSAEEIAAINTARAANKRMFLSLVLDAHHGTVFLDNISLKFSGEIRLPDWAGEIAYLERDETGKPHTIKRIHPDGSGQQVVWTHPGTAVDLDRRLEDITWTPDATGISFISNHENFYSANMEDVYVIAPDGNALRRLTNAPSRFELAQGGYATGTITGRIVNTSDYDRLDINPMYVYVQGARSPVQITPPHKGMSVDFTIPEVADLGPGVRQTVTVIWSEARTNGYSCVGGREFMVSMNADVEAGATVDVGESVFTGVCAKFGVRNHTWARDGSKIAFVGAAADPYFVPAQNGGTGSALFTGASTLDMAWSPIDDTILYARGDNAGLWTTTQGEGPGTRVVEGDTVQQPTWLRDGSGYVFSAGNLLEASGSPLEIKLLTDFYNEAAAHPSLSPDGRYVVYERQATSTNTLGTDVYARDLWIMDRENPLRTWQLTHNGRSGSPSWSSRDPSTPPAEQQDVSGTVFEDRNRNGTREGGEPGISGAEIYLRTGERMPEEEWVQHTDGDGVYHFDDIPAGSYMLGIKLPPQYGDASVHWQEVTVDDKTSPAIPPFAAPPAANQRLFLPMTQR